MSERTSRGYMIESTVAYMAEAYDESALRSIHERISPRVRERMHDVKSIAWYPVEDVAEILRAIALHHQATDGKVREALTEVGRSIAEMATNTFLKVMLRLLTPKLFVSKLPDLWARDNRCGRLSGLTFQDDKRRIVVELTGIEGYDYIAPVGAGFMFFALEGVFGFKNARADYPWSMEHPGPSEVIYDFRWD